MSIPDSVRTVDAHAYRRHVVGFLPLRRLSAAAVSSSASPCASPRQERMSFVIHSLPSAATPSDIMTTVSPSRSSAPAFENPMRLSMPAGSDGSSSIAVRPERFMKQGAAPALKKLISPEYGSSDAMSRVARLSSSLLAMSAVLTVLSAASQESPEQMSEAKGRSP